MKIVIIADTHGKHKFLELPKADTIIHCGDFTGMGRDYEVRVFMKWFGELKQYKNKIIIAGNHDWLFENNGTLARSLVPDNIIYLEDSEVVIDGIRFYGTPVQKHFCNWAFNRDESILAQHWEDIPNDTDVLITHSPPYMIGDYVPWSGNEGSPSLYNEVVKRIKPKIHCYGHIHEGYGLKVIDDIKFYNASNLDGDYLCVNMPFVVEI